MTYRTDSHSNPAAITTDVAKQGGLVLGPEYTQGDPFDASGHTYYTARLIGDPVALTIKVIDAIGYKTKGGLPRWTYVCVPKFDWNAKTFEQKRDYVGYHYLNEGGVAMRDLFPNYGQQ